MVEEASRPDTRLIPRGAGAGKRPPLRSFDDPASDAAKLLNRLGLAILLIIIPCAGLLSVQALYSLMPVGAVLILAAGILRDDNRLPRFFRALASPCGWLTLFVIFWASLSLLWTPLALSAGERFAKTLGVGLLAALAASFLPRRTKLSDLNLVPVGCLLAGVATVTLTLAGARSDAAQSFETSLLHHSVITLVILIWPALGALALRERWMTAGGLAILVAIAAMAAWAQISLLAMAAGALTFAIAMSQPVLAARIAAAVFALLVGLGPVWAFLTAFLVKFAGWGKTFAAPVTVWTELMSEDGFRVITGHGIAAAARGVNMGYLPDTIPKSLVFELWYDLGIVGAGAFAALILYAFAAAARAAPSVAPALLAGMVVVLTVALLGLATEQIWWVNLVAIDAVAFAALLKASHRGKRLHVPPAQTGERL